MRGAAQTSFFPLLTLQSLRSCFLVYQAGILKKITAKFSKLAFLLHPKVEQILKRGLSVNFKNCLLSYHVVCLAFCIVEFENKGQKHSS